MRTRNNGELRLSNVNEVVTLVGWCSKKRNLGGLIFIDLRDRYGITQVVVEPNNACYELAESVKSEYVLKVTGTVVERSSKNLNIPTGEIEVVASEFVIINTSEQPPFLIQDNTDALEDTRMKYRYLDLRRPVLQKNLLTRHKICMALRNFLDKRDFIEIETPMLGKSTPEGARDFLVPSRIYHGQFYALPQSPQIYKQLLMVAGYERYFQIARCFRDEDLRADRQLEFTQLDLEMSFIDEEDIFEVGEQMLKQLWKEVLDYDVPTPFIRMEYDHAMNFYGSDKPDTRFEMLLNDITETVKPMEFTLFQNVINNGGSVKCIVAKDAANKYSRKEIDRLTLFAKKYHASGLAWVKYENNEFAGSIAKFLNEEVSAALVEQLALTNNDLVLIVADKLEVCNFALGALRLQLGKELNLIDEKKFNFLWVVNWPLFEYSEEEGRYMAAHHPFTSPKDGHENMLFDHPELCRAKAYDVVLNGYELGGGSIRIFNQDIQAKMFKAIGLSEEEIELQFSFFVNALKYGTPPHGGFALGLDRIAMLMTYNNSLREVIAFPKAASSKCQMSEAPTPVSEKQLKELGLKL